MVELESSKKFVELTWNDPKAKKMSTQVTQPILTKNISKNYSPYYPQSHHPLSDYTLYKSEIPR